MDSTDNDLVFVANLASKYKNKSITKKDIYTLGGVILLLASVAFYQTVNAITLQVSNIKLERSLAKYSDPNQLQPPTNDLPHSYGILADNTGLPNLDNLNIVQYGDAGESCNYTPLEVPPTLFTKNNCKPDQGNQITFAGRKYSF